MLITYIAAASFSCTVARVHGGDGPRWCSNGIKVRIAGVQAPDFESASPCRAANPRRVNYRCDDTAAKRSQEIVEHLVLRQTLRCEGTGKSSARVVARWRTVVVFRSRSSLLVQQPDWIYIGGSTEWTNPTDAETEWAGELNSDNDHPSYLPTGRDADQKLEL